MKQFLKSSAWSLLFVFFAVLFFSPIETEDFWYHLASARWIWTHHAVPQVNVFSFENVQVSWLFTQWLGSCVYYAIFHIAGFDGLKIFRVFILVAALGLFYLLSRRKIPSILLLGLLMLLAYGLSNRVLMRPFLFNLIFIQLFLNILYRHLRGDRQGLWIIPAVTILWANTHLAYFIYGFPLLCIFGGYYGVQYFQARTQKRNEEKIKAWQQLKDIVGVLLAFFAASLINPYGFKGALHPILLSLFPDYIGRGLFFNTVSEILPPVYLLTVNGWWFYVLLALVLPVLIKNPQHKLLSWTLFLFALGMFLYGARSVDLFLLVTAWIFAEGCRDLDLRNKFLAALKPFWEKMVYLFLGIGLLLGIWTAWMPSAIMAGQRVPFRSLTFDPFNAIKALEVLSQHDIKGKVFNWNMYGGYILWQGYPEYRPFVDSRNVDVNLEREYHLAHLHPDRVWPALDQKYDFDIVMIEADAGFQHKFMDYIQKSGKWQLILIDGSCVVFVKKGRFKLSGEVASLEQRLQNVPFPSAPAPELLNTPEPLFAVAPRYNQPLEEGVALYALGYRSAALTRLISAAELDRSRWTRYVLQTLWNDAQNPASLPTPRP